MRYASLLNELIEKSGLTLTDISDRCEKLGQRVTTSYLSKLRNGKMPPPSFKVSVVLAKVLNVEPEILLSVCMYDLNEIERSELVEALRTAYSEENEEHIKFRAFKTMALTGAINNPELYTIDGNKSLKENYEILRDKENEYHDSVIKNAFKELVTLAKDEQTEYYETHDDLMLVPVVGTISGPDPIPEEHIIAHAPIIRRSVPMGEYFYYYAKDGSMIEEGIPEGSQILVRKQNFVDQGKIGIVLINNEEAALKRAYYQDGTVILQSSNRNVPPLVLPVEQVNIIGQVVRVEFDTD